MSIKYVVSEGMPEQDVIEKLVKLHESIFGDSEDLVSKMNSKPKLLFIMAMKDAALLGYKIGYELNPDTFYSWLGGVDEGYRKCGIGARLLDVQHRCLLEKGYLTVQTKTMNKWRSMLILNIKNGFDVIETYTDKNGRHKIILEKTLHE